MQSKNKRTTIKNITKQNKKPKAQKKIIKKKHKEKPHTHKTKTRIGFIGY